MTHDTHPKPRWPDPETYAGQPVCARCGTDADGTTWPICAELLPDGPSSIRRIVCGLTCGRYWDNDSDWLCPGCDAIVGDGTDG